jgi:ribosome-binding protein aMBF1 (putative translation factor)
MSVVRPASISAVLDRIRSFRVCQGWAPYRLATEAGINEATLRGMDAPDWNPTARTIEKLERVIPARWQAPPRQARRRAA